MLATHRSLSQSKIFQELPIEIEIYVFCFAEIIDAFHHAISSNGLSTLTIFTLEQFIYATLFFWFKYIVVYS